MAAPDNRAVEKLTQGAQLMQVALEPVVAQRLVQFLTLLLEENKKINLTAVKSIDEGISVHLLDSLAGLPILDQELPDNPALIDVGTGGGLPGIPLACARPWWSFSLLDSTRKKVDFVERAARTLGLDQVQVFWDRAEAAGQNGNFRERFDASVSRAVAPLPVLAELMLPLVRPGGIALAYKGPDIGDEVQSTLRAIEILGGEIDEIREYELPFDGKRGSLVIIRKTRPTPNRYPRRPGIPGKRPL